jgi:hypothetical protein
MAGVYANDNGTWKLPKSVWVKNGGVWRVCSNVYVKHNGSWREMMKTVTISGNQTNFNLHNYVGRPSQPLNLIVTIPANVTISSYDVLPTGGYNNQVTFRYNIAPRTNAFTVGNFPSGSTVIINNNGYISGGGGFGGSGANKQSNSLNYPNIPGAKGGNGSYGIIKGGSGYTCTVVNTGTIAGGGGGGGGSGGTASYVNIGQLVRTGYWDGGDGAGISAPSSTLGQSVAPIGYPASGGAGKGGDCGKNGQPGYTFGSSNQTYYGGAGGVGRPAIGGGIEVAVSGTILGGVG